MSCSQAASKASMACWAFIFFARVSFLRDFGTRVSLEQCAPRKRALLRRDAGAALEEQRDTDEQLRAAMSAAKTTAIDDKASKGHEAHLS